MLECGVTTIHQASKKTLLLSQSRHRIILHPVSLLVFLSLVAISSVWAFLGYWYRDSMLEKPLTKEPIDRPAPVISEAERWGWVRDEFVELTYPTLPHLASEFSADNIVAVRQFEKALEHYDFYQDKWLLVVQNQSGNIDLVIVSNDSLNYLDSLMGCDNGFSRNAYAVNEILFFVDDRVAIGYSGGVCPGVRTRSQEYVALYNLKSGERVRFSENQSTSSFITPQGDLMGTINRDYSAQTDLSQFVVTLHRSDSKSRILASFDHLSGTIRQYIEL